MREHSETVEAEFVETTALAVRPEGSAVAPASLFRTDDPVEVVEKATRVADALKAVVVAKRLVSNIQGKEYPQVEAWLTLAAMLNVNPVVEWTKQLPNGWEARCVVRNASGLDIGAAEAQCTREERSWAKRDDYALRSMAQTRAISKALRAKLGFIMTLAGYQATPAEEIPPAEASEPADDTTAQKKDHAAVVRWAVMYLKEIGVSDKDRHSYIRSEYGRESFNDLSKDEIRATVKHFQELKKAERDAS